MSLSKKTIIFTTGASIVLLILTYLVTVNIETNTISVDSPWISNNFLLAFFGGAFASMIVVLICELQKFCSMKSSLEKYLYYQAAFLYMQLYKMQQNIIDFEKRPEEVISKNLFDEPIVQVQNTINAILGTDYTCFSSKSMFLTKHQAFLSALQQLSPVVSQGKNALEVAIIEIKIKQSDQSISELKKAMEEQDIIKRMQTLLEQNKHIPITAKDYPVSAVLTVHKKHVTDAMEHVDIYLQSLDDESKGSFKWPENRDLMKKSFLHFFDAWSLEKYLKQE
jgi:hypothetical protein